MLKLLFLLFGLFTFVGQASGALKPVDYINGHITGGDSTYLYGRGNDSQRSFGRWDENYNWELLIDFNAMPDAPSGLRKYWIRDIIVTSVEGLVFLVAVDDQGDADDTNDKHYMLRVEDCNGTAHYGNNAPDFDNHEYVMAIGDTDGTIANQINGVRTFSDRNFCEASSNLWLFGEYNVASNRVFGGINDQVTLWKSTDQGVTWTKIWRENTDGIRNISHIHSVIKDPYSNYVFVCTGDEDTGSAIIYWDTTTAWTDNVFPSELTTGFTVASDAQRYRTVQILFPNPTDIYVAADADPATPDEVGIWKTDRMFSSYTRVYNDDYFSSVNKHQVGLGIVASDGQMLLSELFAGSAPDRHINMWSSKDGVTWSNVGKFGTRPGQTSRLYGVFEWKGKLYLNTVSIGSGKNSYSTSVCELNGEVASDEPPIISPVYWVDSTGTDDASHGYRPGREAWKSLEYALEGDRITLGGRVIQNSGTYTLSAGAIVPDWDGNPLTGTAGTVGTVIEGQGRGNTLNIKDNTDFTYLFYFADGAEGRTIFKHMGLADTYASSFIFNLQASANVEAWDSYLGSSTYRGKSSTKGTLKIKRTWVYPPLTGSAAIAAVAANSTIDIRTSAFWGGYRAVYDNYAGTHITMYNSDVIGNTDVAVYIGVSADQVPFVKNCIFNGVVGSKPIADYAGLVEDDEHIDYNSYSRVSANLANNGGSHSFQLTDPLFASATDIHLSPNSPLINAGGIITGVHNQVTPATDSFRNPVLTVPDIGAYEYQGLYFNSGASDGGNGTKALPYNAWSDYLWTGYNLRAEAILYLQGVMGNLDISGLTDTGRKTVKVWPGKKGALSGFIGGPNDVLELGGATTDNRGVFSSPWE